MKSQIFMGMRVPGLQLPEPTIRHEMNVAAAAASMKAMEAGKPLVEETLESPFFLRLLGDPILSKRCDEITDADWSDMSGQFEKVIRALKRIAKAPGFGQAVGLGLSANQIGSLARICVVRVGTDYLTMINPEVKPVCPWCDGSQIVTDNAELATSKACKCTEGPAAIPKLSVPESCLSIPGFVTSRRRWPTIELTYRDDTFEPVTEEFTGIESQCVQHEIDHLNGKLLTDGALRPALRKAQHLVVLAKARGR